MAQLSFSLPMFISPYVNGRKVFSSNAGRQMRTVTIYS
jgi:hypothetical protein